MDWTQTLTIIGSTIVSIFAAIAWIDRRHRQDMDKMDERWKWLFDWAHYEVNDLKSRHGQQGKN